MKKLEKQIQKYVTRTEIELFTMKSVITKKLLEKLTAELKMREIYYYSSIPEASLYVHRGTTVEVKTRTRAASYDDVLKFDNAYLSGDTLYANETIRFGYCFATIVHSAKIPEEDKLLLIATGKLSIEDAPCYVAMC
jgi:hypothetical protein